MHLVVINPIKRVAMTHLSRAVLWFRLALHHLQSELPLSRFQTPRTYFLLSTITQDDYSSPFIHRKLYSGSSADVSVMAKSGIAVCCASAYENANSVEFVSKFIITEQEHLVHTFVSFSILFSILSFHVMELEALRSSLHPASLLLY